MMARDVSRAEGPAAIANRVFLGADVGVDVDGEAAIERPFPSEPSSLRWLVSLTSED